MAEEKAARETALPRFRIQYYDENRSPDVVLVGAREFALAERKFYVNAVFEGSLDARMYVAFLGAQRAKLVDSAADFETWADGVSRVTELEPGE